MTCVSLQTGAPIPILSIPGFFTALCGRYARPYLPISLDVMTTMKRKTIALRLRALPPSEWSLYCGHGITYSFCLFKLLEHEPGAIIWMAKSVLNVCLHGIAISFSESGQWTEGTRCALYRRYHDAAFNRWECCHRVMNIKLSLDLNWSFAHEWASLLGKYQISGEGRLMQFETSSMLLINIHSLF